MDVPWVIVCPKRAKGTSPNTSTFCIIFCYKYFFKIELEYLNYIINIKKIIV